MFTGGKERRGVIRRRPRVLGEGLCMFRQKKNRNNALTSLLIIIHRKRTLLYMGDTERMRSGERNIDRKTKRLTQTQKKRDSQ